MSHDEKNNEVSIVEELSSKLDKGIEDMEQGRTFPHEEAMKIIREKISKY